MTTLHMTSAVRRVGGLILTAGSVFVGAGAAAWMMVTRQLRDEKIMVPGDAPMLAGRRVQGPVTAYVEALVIKNHAARAADGRTFADISDELAGADGHSDEARGLRHLRSELSTAASLRTSLMTSVLAYGVSALVAGIGALFVIVGARLRRPDRG